MDSRFVKKVHSKELELERAKAELIDKHAKLYVMGYSLGEIEGNEVARHCLVPTPPALCSFKFAKHRNDVRAHGLRVSGLHVCTRTNRYASFATEMLAIDEQLQDLEASEVLVE
jgi:hypothetical protein